MLIFQESVVFISFLSVVRVVMKKVMKVMKNKISSKKRFFGICIEESLVVEKVWAI